MCSMKENVIRNFAKFRRKHLCQSLFFNKFACFLANFLKNKPWQRCCPVNFSKVLRAPFLQNTSGTLLLFIMIYKDLFLILQIVTSSQTIST